MERIEVCIEVFDLYSSLCRDAIAVANGIS